MPETENGVKGVRRHYTAFDFMAGLLIAAIIASYFLWVWHYAVSVPHGDDYTQILNRLIIFHNFPQDTPLGLKLGFFIDFSGGQHRLVFLNLVIVTLYKIVGNIDFHVLILFGNCSLIVLLWGLWKYTVSALPVSRNRIAYFLPVALLVLSPAYFEASLWATGVLQNLPVLVFAFLAIACAAQRSIYSSLAALLVALLAIGTAAGGMVVFLACAAMLISQRRVVHAALAALLFIMVAWIYTRGFPNDPSIPVTTSPSELIRFFLTLCGAIVWGKNGAIFLGTLLVAGFSALTWYGLPKRSPVLWGFGIFLLLTMAMMSVGRAGFGVDAALLSRYKPYSGLLLAVVYLGTLFMMPSIAWKKIIGFSGLLISCSTYVSYLIHYDADVTDFGFHPKLRMAYRGIEGKEQVTSGFPGTDFANYVIDTSERFGIYRPPRFTQFVVKPVSLSAEPALVSQGKTNAEEGDLQVDEFIDGKKAALIYGMVSERCAYKSFRLVLKNGSDVYYFDMQPPDWGWISVHINPDRPIYGIWGGIVDKRFLPVGQYQLGGVCDGKAPTFFGSNYLVSKSP